MTIWGIILFWLGIGGKPTNYNLTEYFEDAFKDGFQVAWRNTPFDESFEYKSMSYFRMLTCFFFSGLADIVDRRALSYQFNTSTYSTTGKNDKRSSDKTINRMKKTMRIDSAVKNIIKQITKLYDNPPKRIFSETQSIQDKMTDIYIESNVDSMEKQNYELAKLCGLTGVLPYYENDNLQYRIFTPDEFRVKIEKGKVTEFWYPTTYDNKVAFRVLTPDVIKTIQVSEGKDTVIEEFNNFYGRIPISWLKLGESSGFYPGGKFELVEAQLSVNAHRIEADLDAAFNATPIKIGINIPEEMFTNAPDEVILVNDVTWPTEMQRKEPELKYTAPNPTFQMLDEFADARETDMKKAEGIPNSIIDGDSEPPSGISRLLEMSPLLEMKFEDIPKLQNHESDLAELIKIITNTDTDTNIGELDFSLHFPPERIVVDPETEYEFDKLKVSDNQMDVLDFLTKWGSFEGDFAAAQRVIDERKENFEKLNMFSKEEVEGTEIKKEIDTQLENIDETIG